MNISLICLHLRRIPRIIIILYGQFEFLSSIHMSINPSTQPPSRPPQPGPWSVLTQNVLKEEQATSL